jgi:hypothetical protein
MGGMRESDRGSIPRVRGFCNFVSGHVLCFPVRRVTRAPSCAMDAARDIPRRVQELGRY